MRQLMRITGIGGCIAIGLAAWLPLQATAATPWQRDWDYQGGLFDRSGYIAWDSMRATDTGETVMFLPQPDNVSATRLREDGSLNWRTSLSTPDWAAVRDVMASAQGGATLLYRTSAGSQVAQLASDGRPVWNVSVPADKVVSVGSNLVVIGCADGRPYVTALDQGSGTVDWQRALSTQAVMCHSDQSPWQVAIAAGGASETYVTHRGPSQFSPAVLKRLDPAGNVVWSVSHPFSEKAALHYRGGKVYVSDGQALWAFRAVDGELLWRRSCLDGEAFFVRGDPVCRSDSSSFVRLRADTGETMWTRYVSGGRMLGSDESDLYYMVGAEWQRWSGASGETRWQAPYPAEMAYRPLLLGNATGSAVAIADDAIGDGFRLNRYLLSNGSLLSSSALPKVTRAASGGQQLSDGGDVFVASATNLRDTRVRRLSADSGNILWENGATGFVLGDLAATPASLALAESNQNASQVRSLDRSSGTEQWTHAVPVGDRYGTASRIFGTAGGDLLGLSERNGMNTVQHEVWRLDATDGSEAWRRTLAQSDETSLPEYLAVAALQDDLVVAEYGPDDALQIPPQRIDAATGVARWSGATSERTIELAVSPARDAVFSIGSELSGTGLTLTKRDAANGEVVWQFVYQQMPGYLHVADLVPLADGDVLVALTAAIANGNGGDDSTSARLLRIKADGSGLRYERNGPAFQPGWLDSASRLRLDDSGTAVWMLRNRHNGPLSAVFLERFDLASGRSLGAQFYSVNGTHPLFPTTAWDSDFTPYQGKILAGGVALRAPQVATRRDALRDFSIGQRGDLRLSIAPLPPNFAAGALLDVDVRVDYSGDTAIAGASLIVDSPWHGTHSYLACSGSGISNCSLDTRYGQWVLRFDAAPGAQLQLSGRVRALAWPQAAAAQLRGVVFGPESLLESDSSNNTVSSLRPDLLFADGFQ